MKPFNFEIGKTLFILLFLSLAACSPPHYMYAPTAVHVPGFTQKGQSSLDLALSANGTDLQAGYALGNHLAILGSWYWRRERQYDEQDRTFIGNDRRERDSIRYLRSLLTGGLAYFTPIDDKQHFFFLASGAYGKGHFSMTEHDFQKAPDSSVSYAYSHNHAKMRQVYIQSGIMAHFSPAKIIFNLRWTGVVYNYPGSTQHLEDYGIRDNILYSFLEPSMTIKFSPPNSSWLDLFMQAGISVPARRMDFDYRPFIGNIGIGIDPVGLFQGRGAAKPATPSL